MLEFAVALLATVVLLPVISVLLRWRNIVDVPNHRSSHVLQVYRGGGLACLLGATLAFGAAQIYGTPTVSLKVVTLVVGLALIGLMDDVATLPASLRLAAQAVIGGASGWVVGGNILWLLAGVALVAVVVNVVNFMDGINGITGLTVGLWGMTSLVLAARYHSEALGSIAAITTGAALGFLPANIPNARLFLGDVGSYLLGALIGVGLVVGWRDGVPVLALVAPLSVYLVDTSLTLIRRAVGRRPLMSAHREHIYQRLVSSAGLSHVVAAAFATSCAAAITGSYLVVGMWGAVPAAVLILTFYVKSPDLILKWRKPPNDPRDMHGHIGAPSQARLGDRRGVKRHAASP